MNLEQVKTVLDVIDSENDGDATFITVQLVTGTTVSGAYQLNEEKGLIYIADIVTGAFSFFTAIEHIVSIQIEIH